MNVTSPANVAASLEEHWSPRVVAEVDDAYVKVAKVHGSLAWHSHDDEDELFYVLKGTLRIEMEDRAVVLNEGDVFVVPDPQLRLDELETVQNEVAQLLHNATS